MWRRGSNPSSAMRERSSTRSGKGTAETVPFLFFVEAIRNPRVVKFSIYEGLDGLLVRFTLVFVARFEEDTVFSFAWCCTAAF